MLLTKKFGTFRLAKHEKATGEGIMDLMNVGKFEITRLATLIKIGNPEIPWDNEEMAYEILDKYLEYSDDNTILTAYFDILDGINRDLKMLKGMDFKSLKKKLLDDTEELANKIMTEDLSVAKELHAEAVGKVEVEEEPIEIPVEA